MKSKNKKISIVTATYNREKYLHRLYESLCKQTYENIEWIIVDDGSTDNTEQVVESFKKSNKIFINYIKKKNGGKHTAINRAIDELQSELTFIVDSDDILPSNSLNKINNIWNEIEKTSYYIIGIGGLKATFDGNIIGSKIPSEQHIDASMIDITYNYNVLGDKSIIFKSEFLKKNKFPEFEGEKFLTEAVLYNRITDEDHKIRWVNETFTLCEYLEDGLTKKYDEIMTKNWSGTNLYFKELLELNLDSELKMKISTDYLKYAYINKNFKYIFKKYNLNTKYKIIAIKKGLILSLKIKIKRILGRY